MRGQALLHTGQTQETVMDTDRHVWRITTAVPPMDQTHEACAKQVVEKITRDLSHLERDRSRDTGQGNHRQRTRGTDRGTWHRQINAPTVARSSPKRELYRYTFVNQNVGIYREMRSGWSMRSWCSRGFTRYTNTTPR